MSLASGYWEAEAEEEWYDEEADEWPTSYEELIDQEAYANLNGFGEKCFHCQGFGHYARECPQKGKGKGKSKGSKGKSFVKAKGKGSGKS